MSQFILVVVVMIACLSTLLLLARVAGALTYSKIERHLDAIRGVRRSFPIFWPFVISFITWAYIIIRPF